MAVSTGRLSTTAQKENERPGRKQRPPLSMLLLATLFVVYIALPLTALVWRALDSEHAWNYLNDSFVLKALRLSLETTAIALAVAIGFGTPVAYLLARYRFPGKRLVSTIIDLPLVLPPVVAGIALLMAFGRRGVLGGQLTALGISLPFTTAGVIVAQIFVASPFYVRSAVAGFSSVPKDVEEAARVDGASMWRTLIDITMPVALPSMTAGAVLCWSRALSEFGATLLFAGNLTGRTQTMPLAIMTAYESSLGQALALSSILLVMSFLILFTSRVITDEANEL